jgi:putative membrane protein
MPTSISQVNDDAPGDDRRWPRSVYGVGTEPDARFSLANERTFLAWIRTALGFLAGGAGIAAVSTIVGRLSLELKLASLLLLVCGLVCSIGAYVRWFRNERAMRTGQPLPSSPAMPLLTAVLAAVAVLAIIVVGWH